MRCQANAITGKSTSWKAPWRSLKLFWLVSSIRVFQSIAWLHYRKLKEWECRLVGTWTMYSQCSWRNGARTLSCYLHMSHAACFFSNLITHTHILSHVPRKHPHQNSQHFCIHLQLGSIPSMCPPTKYVVQWLCPKCYSPDQLVIPSSMDSLWPQNLTPINKLSLSVLLNGCHIYIYKSPQIIYINF